jgi:lysine 2,3-aminomutase
VTPDSLPSQPHAAAEPAARIARAILQSPQAGRATRGRAHFFPGVADALWNDWRWQFRNRVHALDHLAGMLPFPPQEHAALGAVLREFRMGITPYYLSLIDPMDPADPIARQVVPVAAEGAANSAGVDDPLGEELFSPVPGITHRYPDRCLMVVSNSCAIYCRYCTRKRIMAEDVVSDLDLQRMVDYIAGTPAIRDVVVSGGDPLTFATDKLDRILTKLRAIPHLEIIRIGSRVPVSLPMRIDDELTRMLARHHPLWINVHFNHPNEVTPDAALACDRLTRAGIPLNNQTALLRGVNDTEDIQRALCHGLMLMRVRPYYLYHCDPVRGADHFRTTMARGIEIIESLRGHTSGLAIPQFAVDAPGGGGKIPLNPQYVLSYESGRAVLRNFQGHIYEARDPHDLAGGSMPPPLLAEGETTAAARATSAPAGDLAADRNDAQPQRSGVSATRWVHPRR